MQLAARCRSVQRCNIGIFRRLVWCGQPENRAPGSRVSPETGPRSGQGGAGRVGVEWGGVRWNGVG